MVNKLKYEPHLDKAMHFIFGKTLICRNLEIATAISKQSMLDCITIDGDQVSYIFFIYQYVVWYINCVDWFEVCNLVCLFYFCKVELFFHFLFPGIH